MKPLKVLIVDDEPSIREFVGEVLSSQYQVIFAKNGDEALEVATLKKPALIVMDIVMPGMNGIESCRQLRNAAATRSIPVLMLTALNSTEQRIDAFQSGADDYIAKPFSPDELLARVEAKIRRQSEVEPKLTETIHFGDLSLNFQELNAKVGDQKIEVGQIEFKILGCLIKNQGQLVKREALHKFVWGNEEPADRALDPHITTLRKKLKPSRGELKTVYGVGYSLVMKELA